MDTKALEKFCPWARIELIDAVHLRCAEYGLNEEGRAAFPAGSDMVAGNVLGPELKALRDAHYESIEHMGYDAFLEHQAYSWFNRFAAIRYMELHDFLPNHIRMVSSSTGDMYPDCVHAVAELELEGLNRTEAIDLAIAGENEKLYRSIILAQCKELAQALPSVFAGADELTLPNNLLGHGEHDVLHHLVADIPEEAWENVEVLGWMYQFYNSELKDAFFKSKHKAMAEDIPPATQLFTPDWIVRYMVENSLGRLWMLNNPGSRLRERMEYYIEPDGGHEDFIRVDGPEDITFCDPACGSGHILVYAFSMLFQMYTERGYRERDIPELILTKNLTGLEIDDRAAQIASLALALCAREHDRRFFTRGITASIQVLGSIEIDVDALDPASALRGRPKLLEALTHLGEVGSLLHPSPEDMGALKAELMRSLSGDLFVSHTQESIARAAETCEALSRTFDVVVANPPYMGSSSFNPFMSKWMKKHYPDSCKDLCTAFIERGYALAAERGYAAMVTMQSWMFLGSFEKMRNALIDNKTIVAIAHLGFGAFSSLNSKVVSVAVSILFNSASQLKGSFIRLVDLHAETSKRKTLLDTIDQRTPQRLFQCTPSVFSGIPSSPIAYWASNHCIRSYREYASVGSIFDLQSGLTTGDNESYMRNWWEIQKSKFTGVNTPSPLRPSPKWYPCNHGGGYRRWYGNNDTVINWENNGYDLRNSRLQGTAVGNSSYFLIKCLTWGRVTTSKLSMRLSPAGFIPEHACGVMLPNKNHPYSLAVLCALYNSTIGDHFLSLVAPTLNFTQGPVGSVPLPPINKRHSNLIEHLSLGCISLSQADWDTQETSWDFKRNALI